MNRCFSTVAVISVLILTAGCSKGPGGVAKDFEQTAASGNTAAALDEFDPSLRQVGGMKLIAGMNQAVAKMKAKGGLKGVEVVSSTTDGDQGTVTLKDTFGDGTSSTSTDKMRKVDGKWYVTM